MATKALYIDKQFKKSGRIFELICGAEKEIAVGELLTYDKSSLRATFKVQSIEAFRKEIPVLPKMYSGLVTLNWIDGVEVNFEAGDFLYSQD